MFGFDDSWNKISDSIEEFIVDLGWTDVPNQFPLLLVTWGIAIGLIVIFSRITKTPWGRVLRAVREDEDAARALGKNAFSYKLQSLALAATTGAIAGFLFALNLKFVVPDEFQPLVTFTGYAVLILGGLANYWGVALGVDRALGGARGPAIPRAAHIGDEDRRASLHHPRARADRADGVQAAGILRQSSKEMVLGD